MQAAAVSVYNQVPLLRGINDDASVLAALLSSLISHGVTPSYIFIGRPVLGNRRFALPLRQAWSIYTDAISRCTGLAKTAKPIMSHSSGKIEVLGFIDDLIVMRCHQSPDCAGQGRLLFAKTTGGEMWFDEWMQIPVP